MITLGDRRYCVELVVVIDNGNRTFEKKRLALIKIFQMKLPAASCGVSCEILRSYYPPSPRLRRVLLAFIPVASYGVFGEGE